MTTATQTLFPATLAPAGSPLPGLPGWYESRLAPRLTVMAHESGTALPVHYRTVGWGRPQPFVIDADGRERRFGTLKAACEFAIGAGKVEG